MPQTPSRRGYSDQQRRKCALDRAVELATCIAGLRYLNADGSFTVRAGLEKPVNVPGRFYNDVAKARRCRSSAGISPPYNDHARNP